MSTLGLGCWAIGGPLRAGEAWESYGSVDDQESIRAIEVALDLGITLFDTADAYGAGHSEKILGRALGARRKEAFIATKFGALFDEQLRRLVGEMHETGHVRRACEASLRRLKTDYIDLYLFHLGDWPAERAGEVREALEQLVSQGKIRSYGWSTDDPVRARLFAEGKHCSAMEFELNALRDNPAMLSLCEEFSWTALARSPLAMGLLSGKYDYNASFGVGDLRGGTTEDWVTYFKDGKPESEFLARSKALRESLTQGGRTPVQGALAWLWARHPQVVPIPGFKNEWQVREFAQALRLGARPLVQGLK